MNRTDTKTAHLPRIKLLPAGLAMALAVGGGTLSGAYVDARDINVTAARAAPLTPLLQRQRHAGRFIEAERQAWLDSLQQRPRTIPAVPAGAIAVTNCNDEGPGSYRQAMADAVDGDTIDLTATGCSTITLTTGDVVAVADNLTLQGPGMFGLSIYGNFGHSTLQHFGTGNLVINDLTFVGGSKYLADGGIGNPAGGCVSSQGFVTLDHAAAESCSVLSTSTSRGVKGGAIYGKEAVGLFSSIVSGSYAYSAANFVYGGGVYSGGNFVADHSLVLGNSATNATEVFFARGGGVAVGSLFAGGQPGGSTQIKYSTIAYNSAFIGGPGGGVGGGLYTTGDFLMSRSTISGNSANLGGGLFLANGPNVGQPWAVLSSTISGNEASGRAGGVYVGDNAMSFQNSTIASNTVQSTGPLDGAGIHFQFPDDVEMQSTIVANNLTITSTTSFPDDIGGSPVVTPIGANNLVFATSLSLPGDTILLTDPMLKPLADNGGPTNTHALDPLSTAIDAGNSTFVSNYDQRGDPHPRVIGAEADIGAYEFDLNDLIFADGFD